MGTGHRDRQTLVFEIPYAEAKFRDTLTIADDGVGPPAGFDSTGAQSAGLVFVNSFALQIGGSFRLESGGRGARSRLRELRA